MPLANGFIATRSGYFSRTWRSVKPFARAVTTYGLCSSSSRFARMTRTRAAVPAIASTTPGIGRCWSRSMTFPKLHAASMYSRENSPPMFAWNHTKPK